MLYAQIRGGVLHFAVERRELLVERMDNSHSRAVLAIQIVDFFRDVVRFVLQPPHFLLESFALASYARERILLRSELRFSLILSAY